MAQGAFGGSLSLAEKKSPRDRNGDDFFERLEVVKKTMRFFFFLETYINGNNVAQAWER